MGTFVRFLVKQLVISLQGKAQNYRNDRPDGNAKGNLFMMNNQSLQGIREQNNPLLDTLEVLNTHLTVVDDNELNYQNNKDVLSLESGKVLKSRFSGFIEDL